MRWQVKKSHLASFELGESVMLAEIGGIVAEAMRGGCSYLEAIAGLPETASFFGTSEEAESFANDLDE